MNSETAPRTSDSPAPARKAVVLARGLGTRMRRKDEVPDLDPRQGRPADSGMKGMIPFERPFLDYLLRSLADAGMEVACLVVGPEHAAIREYYTRTSPPRRLRVAFALQKEPRGTADAILAAEAFVAGDDFLSVNSDNYYPQTALRGLRNLSGPGVALFEREGLLRESNIPPDRVRAFAACRLNADGTLGSIVEKPGPGLLETPAPDLLISMNCWRFSRAIFRACREIGPSPRGELELPAAVQHALAAHAARFQVVHCREGVLDLSCRTDILAVAERLRHLPADP